MRVGVLGAGAMGCLFGGLLHRAGHDVTLVDVSVEQIRAINEHGLILERDGEVLRIPVPARFAGEVAIAPDLLIVFTKTLHSRAALESARGFIGPATTLLTLQNGLGNAEIMECFVPRERVVQGITTFPAYLVSAGRVHSLGPGQTKIMALDGRVTPRLEEVCSALEGAGLSCEISPGATAAIWEKVAFNAALNTLTAVTGLTVGPIADSPEARDLARRIAGEVVRVANRKGIEADLAAVLETMEGALAAHRGHQPSMLQDMAAHRRTEVESLNGAVVREAGALGMEVPFTEALYLLVRTLESANATA